MGNFDHGSTTRQLYKARVGQAEGRGRHLPLGHSMLEVGASEQRCEGYELETGSHHVFVLFVCFLLSLAFTN